MTPAEERARTLFTVRAASRDGVAHFVVESSFGNNHPPSMFITREDAEAHRDRLAAPIARAIEAAVAEERAAAVAWLRTTPTAGGTVLRIESSQDIARLADGIERGEHRKRGA